jgi:hypothetical protein
MQPIQSAVSQVWRSPAGAIVPLIVACLLFVVLGCICIRDKKMRMLGCFLIGIAVVAAVMFAPTMLMERVVVSPSEFSVTSGFWFAPVRQGFVYQKVQLVRFRTLGRKPAWQIDFKDGHKEMIGSTPLWVQNEKSIIEALERHGISFRNDVIGY